MKPLFKNKVFEIKAGIGKGPRDFRLIMNGELVAEGGRIKNLFEFTADNGSFKKLLDVDISLMPRPMHYLLMKEERGYLNLQHSIVLVLEKKQTQMRISFEVDDAVLQSMYINPYHLLQLLNEFLRDDGYKTRMGPPLCGSAFIEATVNLAAKGNLFKNYKKHLWRIERLTKKAEKKIIKRISKM